MTEYEKLLKAAMEKLPKEKKSEKRLKIPEVLVQAEGNKTIITNFFQICSIIRREPRHVFKFLLKELAVPGEISGNRIILHRKLTERQINDKLRKYMKKYVFCPVCGKPDTRLIKENKILKIKCEACGAKQVV